MSVNPATGDGAPPTDQGGELHEASQPPVFPIVYDVHLASEDAMQEDLPATLTSNAVAGSVEVVDSFKRDVAPAEASLEGPAAAQSTMDVDVPPSHPVPIALDAIADEGSMATVDSTQAARVAGPAAEAHPPTASTSAAPTPRRLELRLGGPKPGRTASTREGLIANVQRDIEKLVEEHDEHVRELFHLDRYTSLVSYDPVAARTDTSEVFKQFQGRFDLFSAAPPAAGPSTARTTRRAINERRENIAGATRGPARINYSETALAGKGKAKAEPEPEEASEEERGVDEFKPKVPKFKGGARASTGADGEVDAPKKGGKGRKSAGSAAPHADGGAPASTKGAAKGKGKKGAAGESVEESVAGADSGTPAAAARAPYKRKAPVPFLPGNAAKRLKLAVPPAPDPTHPTQVIPAARHGSSLSAFLSSYTAFSGVPEPPRDLSSRILKEARLLNRIDYLKSEGRLQSSNPDRKVAGDSRRKEDHANHLVEQAAQMGKYYIEERRGRLAVSKRASRGIAVHFEMLASAEERKEAELLRDLKALAKWTAREVRKKWKLAADVIRGREAEQERRERERLGKQQLDAILEQSMQTLAARTQHLAEDAVASSPETSRDSTPETVIDSADEEQDEEDEEDGDEEEADGVPQLKRADESPSLPPPTIPAFFGDDDGMIPGLSYAPPPVLPPGPMPSVISPPLDATPAAAPAIPIGELAAPAPALVNGDSTVSQTNGAIESPFSANGDAAAPPDVPLVPRLHKGKAKAIVDDTEFVGEDDVEREDADAEMEADMDAEEGESDESEMDGLANDAELPLEDLLAKYGYAEGEAAASADVSRVTSEAPSLDPTPSTSAATPLPEDVEATGDVEFSAQSDEEREEEDADMEAEMEQRDGESASSDVEMGGLAADADIPLEQLLGNYRPGEDLTPEPSDVGATPPPDMGSPDSDEARMDVDAASSDDDDEMRSDTDATASDVESEESEYEAKRIKVKVPFLLRGTLRPYQKGGLDWLASLYVSGLNGILADEMGLGKTIQTISLLGWLAVEKGIWGPHLIVVPTSVMLNWEMEFKKFLPGFKILTYYGNQRERKEKRKGWNTENSFHVCVTSYQIVLADQHMFRRKPWHYLVLDEAHHIKNFRSQRWQTLLGFNTKRRLLLTGTPLQNNLMELWSLLYFLMPAGVLEDGKSGPFANHKDFLEWFSNPMEKAIESGEGIDEETRATVQRLHTVLRPYLLRRLKADVEKEMPAKYEHIVYCRLSRRQRYLYDDFMSRGTTRDTLSSGNFMGVINCLMQLRKVCNHPDLFEVRPISTSFAMSVPAASTFTPADLVVRQRLLADGHFDKVNLPSLNAIRTGDLAESTIAARERRRLDATRVMPKLVPPKPANAEADEATRDLKTEEGWRAHLAARRRAEIVTRVQRMVDVNHRRCAPLPLLGSEIIARAISAGKRPHLLPSDAQPEPRFGSDNPAALRALVRSYAQRSDDMKDVISRYAFATPMAIARDIADLALPGVTPEQLILATEPMEEEDAWHGLLDDEIEYPSDPLQLANVKLSIAFPDRSLLQYDCGKLQKLSELLHSLVAGGHRALIFTQMTKVLDILETFLSFHGWRYLRLDGSTKVEDRQIITERFNRDTRILCFISSTRAGGLGINLTGADTVVFYDSDWNPSMDRQCQDRCHRIGQTRDVHIYRFVSESTIEENVLRKANQKKQLDNMVIAEGEFTTEYFNRVDWREMLGTELGQQIGPGGRKSGATANGGAETPGFDGPPLTGEQGDVLKAFEAAEDEEDAAAAHAAAEEDFVDTTDFADAAIQPAVGEDGEPLAKVVPGQEVVEEQDLPATGALAAAAAGELEDEDGLEGTIDGWMLHHAEEYWEYFGEL